MKFRWPFMLRSTHERILQFHNITSTSSVNVEKAKAETWRTKAFRLGKALSDSEGRQKSKRRFAARIQDKHERKRRTKKLLEA